MFLKANYKIKKMNQFNNFAMYNEISLVFATRTLLHCLNLRTLKYRNILNALKNVFERYFLELNRDNLDLVQNLFRLPTEKVLEE